MRLLGPVTLVALLSGCDSGEDSWDVYQRQHIFNGGAPSLTPDGQSVAFSSPRSGRADIYCLARKELKRLTESEDFEGSPIFSPSGDRIAYVRETGGWRHVWVMNADGSNQTQLTEGHVLDDLAQFSSDGKALYFTRATASTGLGREALCYRMDTDGQNVQPQPLERCSGRANEFPSPDFSPREWNRAVLRVIGWLGTTTSGTERGQPDGDRV